MSSSRRRTRRRSASVPMAVDHSRCLVRRSPRVVPAARRPAPALADAAGRAERRRGLHRFGILATRARRRLHVDAIARSTSSRPGSPAPAGRAPAIAREPLVLFVGSMFNRRRLPDLIAAFARGSRHRRQRASSSSATIAPGRRRTCRRSRPTRRRGRDRFRSYIRRRELDGSTPGVGVRVPLGVRRLRADAARGALRRCADGRARHAGRARGLRRGGGLCGRRRHRRHGARVPPAPRRAACARPASCDRAALGPGALLLGRAARRHSTHIERIARHDDASRSSSSATTRGAIWSAAWSRCRIAAGDPARHHRGGQRVDRRQPRRRPCAVAGDHGHRARANLGFAAANNVGIRATRGELVLLLEQRHARSGRAPSDRSGRRLWRDPEAAVAGPRLVDGDGRAELSFGAMISPLPSCDRSSSGCYARARRRRAVGRARDARASSTSTGSAAPACWSGGGRRSRRAARRALLHVHRGRRLLRGHPRARPRSSSRRAESSTCAGALAPPRRRPDAGLPPQPARVLREAPSALGCRVLRAYLRAQRRRAADRSR